MSMTRKMIRNQFRAEAEAHGYKASKWVHICPCKGCAERHECCHSHCEKYKNWKAEMERIKEEIRKNKELERITSRYRRF